MLIFWDARLVLLAVPKTGTTALEAALDGRADLALRQPGPIKHVNLRRFERHVRPLLEAAGGRGFETVAVVREPVSWLSSWYRYRHRDWLVGKPQSTRGVSFDRFVAEWASGRPAPWAQAGTQHEYVFGPDGARAVTHLFRHDRPEALMAFLRERLGDVPAPGRANVSPDVPVELSAETLALARRQRPQLFEVWREAGGEG